MQDQPPPIDTRRLIIGMALAMAIVLGWQFGVTWLYKRNGWKMPSEQAAATQPVAPYSATPSATGPTTGPGGVEASGPGVGAGGLRVASQATQPQPMILGSGAERDPTYAMQLTLDPTGAGVKSVVLNDFKQSADTKKLYVFQEPYANYVAQSRPLGTRSITVNGQTVDLGNVTWNLADDADPNAATYTVDLVGSAGPVARLSKTFRVFPRDTKERPGSGGFEVLVDYAVQNLSGGELKVRTAFNGPTLPPPEVRRGPDRQVISGYEEDQHVHVASHIVEEFKPEEATRDLTKNKNGRPVVWSGTASVYFEGIVLPVEGKTVPAAFLQDIKAEGLDVRKETEPADRTIATVFETKELTIPAGGQVSLPLNTYFGPRWRNVLNADYYKNFPRSYNQTLVIVSGYCSICTFQWLIDVLVKMLGAFHFITRDWGLAIICLVVVVRTLLHPVTKRSQVSMMKMGKMGPEMERLKKKYGDNKEELSKAMWEFQKTQGVTPILGCLPMFLQMPIWIALWSALQSTFELRQAPFLWGYTWINDLAKPDALVTFAHALKLPFGIHIESLNILPVFLGVVFFVQQKMTPKPPAMSPEQAQQQKMMQWMSLLFPVFLYGGPSGLNLYILTSTTIGIIESKRIRDHIKQREEAEKSGQVVIDARPTRGNKKKDKDRRDPPEETKKRGVMGWLADLQARAEEMRSQADRRGGK